MFHGIERKKVLVTGGTGFIGRYLVQRLSDAGNDVKVLAREQSDVTPFQSIDNVSIAKGDICDFSSLPAALDSVDIVFHLAAILHLAHDVRSPLLTKVNVKGTKNLLEACRGEDVSKFVYFSTVGVGFWESALGKNIDPDSDEPSYYGMSKLLGEKLVNTYHEQFGLNTTILRLPAVYGYGDKGNMKKLINAVRKRRFVLIGDGNYLRSLSYVKNVVNAALCVAADPKADGKIYNVSDGEPLSIKEIATVIAETCNVSLLPLSVSLRVARPLALLCEAFQSVFKRKLPFNTDILRRLTYSQTCRSNLITKELGFIPIGFREGISETIKEMYGH
jgi:nucleoside-diphosphate-sugar epimerase